MKILLSCVPFDRGKSGISVYIRHLTAALAARGEELTLIVEADAASFFPGFRTVTLPRCCRSALISMLYHLFILPFRINFRKFDMMILCAANRRALCRYPIFTAAVVHDLSQYHIPTKYDAFRMFYIRRLLPHFVRKAQMVTAISRSTAADLREYWKIPPEKIAVIGNGLSLPPGGADAGPWLREHGVTRPFLLYVSRLEHPGKNHVNLIRAYDMLPPELAGRYDLVLPGAPWNGAEAVFRAAQASPYADHIHFPGFVPAELLVSLYRRAACYVFPSFFEGFGLSLIEAMSCGVPCGCSNCSSLKELGEEIYADYVAYLFQKGETDLMAEILKKWYNTGKYSYTFLSYSYNVLAGMEPNGIIFVNGDMPVFSSLLVKYGKDLFKDKTIICVGMFAAPGYLDNLCKELGIELDVEQKTFTGNYITEDYRQWACKIFAAIAQKTGRPVYFSTFLSEANDYKFQQNVYSEGLVNKYSTVKYDNLAIKRRNFEEVYLTDYLLETFVPETYNATAYRINLNYLPCFKSLLEYYRKTGNKTQEDKLYKMLKHILDNSKDLLDKESYKYYYDEIKR